MNEFEQISRFVRTLDFTGTAQEEGLFFWVEKNNKYENYFHGIIVVG